MFIPNLVNYGISYIAAFILDVERVSFGRGVSKFGVFDLTKLYM